MTRALALPIAVSLLLSARSAAAETVNTYDTVDAVESVGGTSLVRVTGIIAGRTETTTIEYRFGTDERISTCVRLALLAMSKPGRFQFLATLADVFGRDSCKLAVRAQ